MRIVKNAHKACIRIAANYLIAKDALIRAGADMPRDMFNDSVQHLTDNTIESILMIGGKKELDICCDKFGISNWPMNELFDRCLANVNPDTKAEVRKNMKTIAERADITFPYEEGDD